MLKPVVVLELSMTVLYSIYMCATEWQPSSLSSSLLPSPFSPQPSQELAVDMIYLDDVNKDVQRLTSEGHSGGAIILEHQDNLNLK